MPSKKAWYYCSDCGDYYQDLKRLEECRSFGHRIKRRTPIQKRLVYSANEDIPQFIKVNVDGDDYNVHLRFLMFKTDNEKRTYCLSTLVLDPPLKNICNRLNHLFPFLHITSSQLTDLMKNAIIKGTFEEVDKNTVKILLTLNSWLSLQPKNSNSKLIFTSRSKVRRLTKNESEILAEAHRTMKPMR